MIGKSAPRLTVNLGLRYDLMGPYHEAYNRTSFLNPLMPNPAAGGRLGALAFAGYGPGTCNCGNVPMNTHYLNFGPRLGLAFKLDDKTVIRTGFGIMYAHQGGTGNNGTGVSPGQLGFNANASFASAVTGQPAFFWDNGVPPYQKPPFIDPGYGAGFTTANPSSASSLNYVPSKIAGKPPYFENWNFGIQRELTPNMTVGATYAGSGSHYVLGNSALGNLDQLHSAAIPGARQPSGGAGHTGQYRRRTGHRPRHWPAVFQFSRHDRADAEAVSAILGSHVPMGQSRELDL